MDKAIDPPKRRTRASKKVSGPTMVAVAEAAKVSIFTVSAVLNGTSVVSDALRERVEEAIRLTGYKRNSVARSLKTGRTQTVGVVIGDITNPFYTDVVAAVQQVLYRAGYGVMLCCNDRNVTLQSDHIAVLHDRMVDGLIIAPTGDDEQLRTALEQTHLPVVLIDRILEGLESDAVIIDNRAAVVSAMRYLLSLGHRRIGFVAGMYESFTGRERLAGYHAALGENGVEYEPDLVQLGNFRIDDAYNATLRLMTQHNPPTAIFSSNNLMVIGVMKALSHLGLNCPNDVSVAGLDDFPWSDAFQPRLTTVAQPTRRIGEQAAHLLLERLEGKVEGKGRRIVLDGELKVRESCRRATAARPAAALTQ
jgi:LacI family transcriptional regulator, galactose operon repressor